jgi:hypothetical protein
MPVKIAVDERSAGISSANPLAGGIPEWALYVGTFHTMVLPSSASTGMCKLTMYM